MIKYRIYFEKIEKVEIEKETKNAVWINGSKCIKGKWAGDIYDTYEEAKNKLIHRIKLKIESLKKRQIEEEEFLSKVEKLTEKQLQARDHET